MIFEEYSNVIELVIFVAGGFGVLQKVGDMERYHQLRVVFLTAVFSLAMIVLFVTNVFMPEPLIESDNPGDTFTLSCSF